MEVEGLTSVLSIIKAVANYDDNARIALCEHPNWAPVQVLLGLLGCSVPIMLKSEILLTLTALAKSKETAVQIWTNLENSQIISTIPSTNNFSKFLKLYITDYQQTCLCGILLTVIRLKFDNPEVEMSCLSIRSVYTYLKLALVSKFLPLTFYEVEKYIVKISLPSDSPLSWNIIPWQSQSWRCLDVVIY